MGQWPMLFVIIIAISCSLNYVSATRRLVCYLNSGASFRNGNGKFTLDNVDPSLCTHLIYVSVLFNGISNVGSSLQAGEQEIANKFVNMKIKNPNLKIMVSVGNWNEFESENYVVKAIGKKDNFARLAVEFLSLYNLTGLDISWPWEFTSLKANNRKEFVKLLKALKKEFQPHGYLLSVSVTANRFISDLSYDIPEIEPLVDFVNLNSYNMTSSWNSNYLADHHAPLYRRKWETTGSNNVDSVVSYWIDKGMPTSKLNMGIPFFGNSWTMSLSSNARHPPAAASGPGAAGPFTKTEGLLAFYEICALTLIKKSNNEKIQGPIGYSDKSGGIWVGYDDARTVKHKGEYILKKNLGGAVVWDISMDDFQNSCGSGTNPLLNSLSKILLGRQPLRSGSGSHFSHFSLANLTLTMFLLLLFSSRS